MRAVDVDLERDLFLRSLIRELAGTLEETVGLDDAAGYVSVVGDRIGHAIDTMYNSWIWTAASCTPTRRSRR